MAEIQTTVNGPLSGTNIFAVTNIPWNGSTAYAQPITLRDPITGAGLPIDPVNGIVVQGGVRVTNFPANQTVSGTVNVGNFPNTQVVSGTVGVNNFPAAVGPAVNTSGTGQFVPVADSQAVIDVSTNGTSTVIAGTTGKRICVTGFDFTSNGTGTVQFFHNSTALTGAYDVVPQFGVSRNGGVIWLLPVGESLNITLAGTGPTAQGSVSYTLI
jgi:hypothetical protein